MERFSLKDLKEAQGKEEYLVEMSHRLAALENLDDVVGIKRAWETGENIIISAKQSNIRYRKYKEGPIQHVYPNRSANPVWTFLPRGSRLSANHRAGQYDLTDSSPVSIGF